MIATAVPPQQQLGAMDSARGCLPPLTSESKIASSSVQKRAERRCQSHDDSIEMTTNKSVSTWSLGGDDDALGDLETKLAHIQWRKHANAKKIRRALDTSKRMHERDLLLQLSVDREGERGRWTEAIVRDELARPADISEMFLRGWERQEDETRKRQLKETKIHLKSIRRVQRAVASKEEVGGAVGNPTMVNVENSAAESGETRPEGKSKTTLQDTLKAMRSGVKEKRRDLRLAAKKELKGSFSASSFKTGRGRW